MRSCEEYELLISASLDGELSGKERAELAEHLTACPGCQQYFDDLAAIHDAFDREEAPVPEGFTGAVMAQVRETSQDGTNKVIRLPNWRRWAALAACCALAALGVWGAKAWMPAPEKASQTVTANGAPPVACGAEPDDAGDGADYGVMATMDEAPVYPAPEAAAEKESQKIVDNPMDGETGGNAAEAPDWQETAADMERDAVPAVEYERDLALEGLALAPAAAGIPENGVVTAGGPAARAWVEETLGLAWEIGRTYPLTEEEYAGLLDALTAAGEDFQQEPGEALQLLAVEYSS